MSPMNTNYTGYSTIKMKKKSAVIILAVLMLSSKIFADANHGPVFKAFYAPYGAGSYMVPHDKTINGGDDGLTSGSSDLDENQFKTLKGYSISAGYFYDWFQGDISYTEIETRKQYVDKNSSPGDEYFSDASLWNADIRGGYRFSNPGDTSYKWLYLGMRKMNLDIPYNDTEVNSIGFLAGFYGFSSFGLSGPFEFVLTYDVYAGTYRYNQNHLSTDVNIDVNRKISVDFGLSAGMGVQYEPWDLAIIIKVSPFITENKYKSEYTGNNKETDAAMMGALIGIEIVFSIPDYKNNIIE